MPRDTRTSKQPETAEYIEKMIPRTLDESIQYAGSIEFNFAQYVNERGFRYPVPGVKTRQIIQYQIRTNASLPFKAGDIIRFDRDDRRRYTITSVATSTSEDKNYRRSFLYPTDEEQVTWKAITLE